MSLKIVYSPIHKTHYPEREFFKGEFVKHVEVPERAQNIVKIFKGSSFEIVEPKLISLSDLYITHDKSYVEFIRKASFSTTREFLSNKYSFDTYTPITRGCFTASLVSASVAKHGSDLVISGEKLVYSLCRPPGHHASRNKMGGYCYFNNAAIAANNFSNHGKVAILDIDFHHGNGTQEIFYERNDVLYVSIHADPTHYFPYSSGFRTERGIGKGLGYNLNFPLAKGTNASTYILELKKGLMEIKKYKPEFLVVSAGFDTYLKDPIGGFDLSINCFQEIGMQISMLNLPTLVVQEGGYCVQDLGIVCQNILRGLNTLRG